MFSKDLKTPILLLEVSKRPIHELRGELNNAIEGGLVERPSWGRDRRQRTAGLVRVSTLETIP